MNSSESPILISLKPHYADLILRGLKRAELRCRDLTRMKGRDVFIYATSPVMELRGGFHIEEVLTGTPKEIWDKVSKDAHVKRPDFEAYYSGRELACALKITDVWQYEVPMPLAALRDEFENFVVPQSWRYVREAEYRLFRTMKKRDEIAGDAVTPPARTLQPAPV